MKNKFIFIIIFFLSFQLQAQLKTFGLVKGNCQLFNGNLYAYGIKPNSGFYIYKLDFKLNCVDSLIGESSKSSPDSYLQSWSDTLHGFLNIYLQKKEKKSVTIFRFNKKFELFATVENVEITRLNNTSLFSSESFYFNNSVYSIKTQSDTSGKQFYLNKYFLKSNTENFDYEFKWQFPFERKNIRSAHIFYAHKTFVFLFVNVLGGIKTGQWILKIEAESGKLVKATKINDKGETNAYLFGDFIFDKSINSIQFAGQKFKGTEIAFKENKFSFPGPPFITLYSFQCDSLGEISNKQDFKIAIVDVKSAKSAGKKDQNSYLLKIENLSKNSEGGLSFTGDVYKGSKSNSCYLYSNTLPFTLKPLEENTFVLEKNTIQANIQLEDYYLNSDKLDMNGKLCSDSALAIENLFYRELGFPVKQGFKTDSEKNPMWILSKHAFKNNSVNYSFLSPVKKIYQITKIEEVNESTNPVFTNLSSGSFIIASQPEEGKYQLKLYNW